MNEEAGQISDRPMVGIGFIVASMVMMTCLDAVAKHLVVDMPVFQMLALRGAIIVVILLSCLPFFGGLKQLRATDRWAQVRRAGYSIAAGFLFFTALRSLPLADITVLVFGGSFFMTLLSAPILGERVGLFRWSAVLIGFSGVVIAAQPSGDNFGPPTFFALSASLCYAMLVIETRRMSRTESTFALTFYTTFGGFLTMAIAAPFVWQPVAETAWPWLLLMAVFSLTAHVLLAKAFIHAPVSTIAPFEYTSLVWAAILGFVFFGDVPGANVWLGAAIVIAAGIIIVQREARLSRSQQPTQPTIGD